MDGPAALAREYYRALDAHDYGAFDDLLAPEFVHDRPDRRLADRAAFVRFMREDRPKKDTTHRVDAIFSHDGNDSEGSEGGDERVAVQGRLLDGDGECFVEFVDVHTVADGQLVRVDTYARS
jgi:ketosteroid isomerase-like protein